MKNPPGGIDVAVVIVSYNTAALTLQAVASAFASSGVDVEVWVVDNASVDGSADLIREAFPLAHVLALGENVGFGRANNVALKEVRAPWVLLLNSDARLRGPGDLRRLVDLLGAAPGVAAVGPRLESPEGRLEHSARAFPGVLRELVRPLGIHKLLPTGIQAPLLGQEFRDHGVPADTDWVTGACLLVRREVFDRVGGFDPAIFLFAEELEWCWRVHRAGWRIRLEPGVTVEHLGGASGKAPGAGKLRLAAAGEAYAVRKHRGVAYLGLFTLARLVGLSAEVLIQGVLGAATGAGERRVRAGHARAALTAFVWALSAGGSRSPSGPALRGDPA